MKKQHDNSSDENIYKLDGCVPLKKAIPFGLQHVLAMFVANLAPVLIVCGAVVTQKDGGHLSPAEITQILHCCLVCFFQKRTKNKLHHKKMDNQSSLGFANLF